jgi:hypothetical protein
MMCMANDDDSLSTCHQCTRKCKQHVFHRLSCRAILCCFSELIDSALATPSADHQHCRPLLNNGADIGAYCSETCKKVTGSILPCILTPLRMPVYEKERGRVFRLLIPGVFITSCVPDK